MASQDQNKASQGHPEKYEAPITIISPWPDLNPISDDDCWSHMSDADIELLGMDREEWERHFPGNPCMSPKQTEILDKNP